MFKTLKGKILMLGLILIWMGGVQASQILSPLLKPHYEYIEKMSMEDKPPHIDNLFSKNFEQVQKLSLGGAFFAAQKTVESLGCDLTPDDILKVAAVSPYGDFIKDYFYQKGGVYEALSNDIPAVCYKRLKCKKPGLKFKAEVINLCQQDILNRFVSFNELYKDQKNMSLELKTKNIFSDKDLKNAPWDLMADVEYIAQLLFVEPKEPPKASFVKPNEGFPVPAGGDCKKENLLGAISFKLCWVESEYKPPSGGKHITSLEEILDEFLAIVEDSKRSGALMEHTKTDEWWETSLQGVKFKDVFSIDFVIDVKPLWNHQTSEEKEKVRTDKNMQIEKRALGWDGDIDTFMEKNKYNVLVPSSLEVVPIAKARSFNESTHWLSPWGEWLEGNLNFWTDMVGLFELFKSYSDYFYQKLQNR